MIIFLYGEDDFRAKNKLAELKDKFLKEVDKSGGSLEWIDGERAAWREINEKSSGGSLLAPKRMIVIENIFRAKDKEMLSEVLEYFQAKENSGNDNIVVFLENFIKSKKKFDSVETVKLDADGREKPLTKAEKELFNFLSKVKIKQEFKKMNNLELSSWIKSETAARGGQIGPRAINALAVATAGDMWQIDNEINKLINYKKGQEPALVGDGKRAEINEGDVEELVRGVFEENIFALTDAIGSKNRALAVKLLEEEIKSGSNEIYILSMIVRQIKIILQARQGLDLGQTPKKIAADMKVISFVANKAIAQARNFNLESLKNILNQLVEIDYKAKSGQGDPLTLLNLLVGRL